MKIQFSSTIHKVAFYIAIIIFLFGSFEAFAQPVNNLVKDVVMPAPNAAALGKYGDIPVSHYTGVPNIDIPIYTAQSGPLSVPISLNYHASGVKVAETASWVGMGWSLSAGGMITRTVQGIPDERDNGYYMNGSNINMQFQTLADVALGQKDSEPDLFNFNVGGYNGKFYFDKDKKAHFTPKQDFIVSVTKSDVDFLSFTLTVSDGTRFTFGQIGTTTAHEKSHVHTAQSFTTPSDAYISSWYLLKIETSDKLYSIDFSYENEFYSYSNKPSCRLLLHFCNSTTSTNGYDIFENSSCSTSSSSGLVVTNMAGKRIKMIKIPTDSIIFNALMDRTDLENAFASSGGATSKKRLDNIVISTGGAPNAKVSTWNFNYDYFLDNTNPNPTSKDRRLKLLSVQETDGTVSKPPHTFEYNGNFIANRHSKAIDHWGFYNGKIQNDALTYNFPQTTVNGFQKGAALRESDETSMKMGVLTKINYPTGGYSQFDFEANRVPIANSAPSQLLALESCFPLPIPGTGPSSACCGSHVDTASLSFTTIQLQNIIKYTLSLDATNLDLSNSICTGPHQATIKVYNAQKDTLFGQIGLNVNLAHDTTGSVTLPLTNLYTNFQPNKTYFFELIGTNGNANFFLDFTIPSSIDRIVGGLRIKSIKSNDNSTTNDIIRSYEYFEPNTNISSGLLTQEPIYGYFLNGFAQTITFESQSVVPLGSFEGYHIGYSHVKELFNGNGTKSYYFQIPLSLNTEFPTPPMPYNKDLGQKTLELTYKNASTTPVSSKTFVPNADNYTFNTGIIYKVLSISLPCVGLITSNNSDVFFTGYNMRTAPYRLSQMKEMIDGVETTTNYTYNSDPAQPLFPIVSAFKNSNGDSIITTTKYITHSDFISSANDTISKAAKRMKTLNIIANPIEVVTKVAGVQAHGSRTLFSCFNNAGLPTNDTLNLFPYP
jgi:hypothetical protein